MLPIIYVFVHPMAVVKTGYFNVSMSLNKRVDPDVYQLIYVSMQD